MTPSNFPPWMTDLATAITIITFVTGIVTLPQVFERRWSTNGSGTGGNFLRLLLVAGFFVLAVFLMRRPKPPTLAADTTTIASDRSHVYPVVPPGGTQPVEIHRPAPQYPVSAQRAGVQGIVVLRGIVRADGTIRSVEVVRGLERTLDEAALRAVRQWRFRPATYRGEPIDVHYTVTMNFRLAAS